MQSERDAGYAEVIRRSQRRLREGESQAFVWRPGNSWHDALGNGRFFAHHPRTEERSGPRSLRMTPSFMFGSSGTPPGDVNLKLLSQFAERKWIEEHPSGAKAQWIFSRLRHD